MLQIESRDVSGHACAAGAARGGWVIVAVLFLFIAINFADKAVIGLVAVQLMHDMGLSATMFGIVGSAFFALFAVSGIGVGYLASRVNLTWLLSALALVWSLAQLPLLWPASVAVLIACRVVLGAGEGPALPVALHVAYQYFDDRRRSLPTLIIAFGAVAGIVVAAPTLTWVAQHWHWRSTFLVLGLGGVAWIALWLIARLVLAGLPAGASAAAATSRERLSWRVHYRHLRDATVLGVLFQSFVGYSVVAVGFTWIPVYFRLGLGYAPERAGMLYGLHALGQVPVGLAMSALSSWLLRRGAATRHGRGVLVSAGCVAGGVMLCLLMASLPPMVKVVLVTVAAALGAQTMIFGPQLVAEVVPETSRAPMLALVHSLATTAGVFAPALTGHAIDVSSGGRGYELAFGLMGLLLGMAGFAGFMLLKPARAAWRSATAG